MPRTLATSLLVVLFLFSGQAEARMDPPGMKPFSIAAKKKSKKKKRKKTKKDAGTGIPAYDKILELNKAMLEIIKKNKADCSKVVSALKAFAEKNHEKHQKLAKQRDEAIAKMSAEQRQALTKRVQEKMWQITKNYWDDMTEVDKKCPYNKVEIRIYMEMFK